MYKKKYPQDLCGILDRKIQILQQPPEPPEKDTPEKSGTKRMENRILVCAPSKVSPDFITGTPKSD
ncbi:MAG: hypothetical protein LBK53_01620 [Heliobacteriaceae bacterium]|nr:hypothetical protein [Heliobacteriaceae bacterium]